MAKRIYLFLILSSFVFGQLAAAPSHNVKEENASDKKEGLLLLAYGMDMVSRRTGEIIKIRNEHVSDLAMDLNKTIPTEVAFGLAEPAPIQTAVDLLEKRGVKSITVVSLILALDSTALSNNTLLTSGSVSIAEVK